MRMGAQTEAIETGASESDTEGTVVGVLLPAATHSLRPPQSQTSVTANAILARLFGDGDVSMTWAPGAIVRGARRYDGSSPSMTAFLTGVKALSALRGRVVDKSEVPVMAVFGVGGSGKTEFLKEIIRSNDCRITTEQRRSLPVNRDRDENGVLRAIDPSPGFGHRPSRCVVLFATFNQVDTFTYMEDLDTQEAIVSRVVCRSRRTTISCARVRSIGLLQG